MRSRNCICMMGTAFVLLAAAVSAAEDDQASLDAYLQKTFELMDENYYLPVSRKLYEAYRAEYTAERLKLLNAKTQQTESFIHLGGGLLVNKLKDADDRFTNLIPPSKTKEFKETAYAVTVDLGLEGFKTDRGFEISRVQRHADAYAAGIRPGDVILRIDEKELAPLSEEDIRALLEREEGMTTVLSIFFAATAETREVTLETKSYFEETVSLVPVDAEGVAVFKISHFNRKTSEDFGYYLKQTDLEDIAHLIVDLRDNTGGPPLAARELMGFFTPPDDTLFYIVRKNRSPFQLNAPIGYPYYEGPLTVLVNHQTGSAAETFSGVLQAKERARIVGQLTAGGAYLKSLYDYEDGSALVMITSRTFFHNREVFPNDGIAPDVVVPENEDALDFVVDQITSSR